MNIEYLIEKYSKLIYKICIDILSSPTDAQDMAQEVYINIYRSFERYKGLPENEIKNIMCKIALNKCKDFLKNKVRKIEILEDGDIIKLENYASDSNIDEEIIKIDKSNYIIKTINRLKEPYNKLLYSYYIEEKSLDEIANIRNTSKGTVKMQLHRAREKLKEEIEKKRGCNLIMIENRKLYNHILDKIDKIDALLNDDEILNNYIIDIENSKIDVPILLDSKIKEKINEEKIKNKVEDNIEATYIKPKYNFINILKVACFTLIVMVSWFGMKNIIIENKVDKIEVKEVNNSLSIISGKVNEYTDMFSSLLLNPIERERGNF